MKQFAGLMVNPAYRCIKTRLINAFTYRNKDINFIRIRSCVDSSKDTSLNQRHKVDVNGLRLTFRSERLVNPHSFEIIIKNVTSTIP